MSAVGERMNSFSEAMAKTGSLSPYGFVLRHFVLIPTQKLENHKKLQHAQLTLASPSCHIYFSCYVTIISARWPRWASNFLVVSFHAWGHTLLRVLSQLFTRINLKQSWSTLMFVSLTRSQVRLDNFLFATLLLWTLCYGIN